MSAARRVSAFLLQRYNITLQKWPDETPLGIIDMKDDCDDD